MYAVTLDTEWAGALFGTSQCNQEYGHYKLQNCRLQDKQYRHPVSSPKIAMAQ
jgi:hypothetical protein